MVVCFITWICVGLQLFLLWINLVFFCLHLFKVQIHGLKVADPRTWKDSTRKLLAFFLTDYQNGCWLIFCQSITNCPFRSRYVLLSKVETYATKLLQRPPGVFTKLHLTIHTSLKCFIRLYQTYKLTLHMVLIYFLKYTSVVKLSGSFMCL